MTHSNADQGRKVFEKLATRPLEGGAQLGQGTAQLGAAGTGGVNLAAHCAGNAGLRAATGKLLLRGLGPAVAGFEGMKNLAEARLRARNAWRRATRARPSWAAPA